MKFISKTIGLFDAIFLQSTKKEIICNFYCQRLSMSFKICIKIKVTHKENTATVIFIYLI